MQNYAQNLTSSFPVIGNQFSYPKLRK